jgi:predicted ArsR family transcriptional regulator
MERLIEIDVMSDLDTKSDQFLEFLDFDSAKNSTFLADHFNIPRDKIRQRMTQLKTEGLVASRREGYTITVRGRTYLKSKI